MVGRARHGRAKVGRVVWQLSNFPRVIRSRQSDIVTFNYTVFAVSIQKSSSPGRGIIRLEQGWRRKCDDDEKEARQDRGQQRRVVLGLHGVLSLHGRYHTQPWWPSSTTVSSSSSSHGTRTTLLRVQMYGAPHLAGRGMGMAETRANVGRYISQQDSLCFCV